MLCAVFSNLSEEQAKSSAGRRGGRSLRSENHGRNGAARRWGLTLPWETLATVTRMKEPPADSHLTAPSVYPYGVSYKTTQTNKNLKAL